MRRASWSSSVSRERPPTRSCASFPSFSSRDCGRPTSAVATFSACSRSGRLRRVNVRHDTRGPGRMTEGLRTPRATPNCGNGPGPAPAIQSGPLRSRFIVGDFAAGRKTSGAASLSVGAGTARLACGSHGGAFHPGTEFHRPPSIFLPRGGSTSTRPVCAGPVRGVGWAHASIRAKRSCRLVTFARPSGRRPNRRARRLSALRGGVDA
jgi:hypothetical protein